MEHTLMPSEILMFPQVAVIIIAPSKDRGTCTLADPVVEVANIRSGCSGDAFY